MTHHPAEPPVRHVWVRNRADHGSPTAGVASSPFGDAPLLDWVEADRLVSVRDARPVNDGG